MSDPEGRHGSPAAGEARLCQEDYLDLLRSGAPGIEERFVSMCFAGAAGPDGRASFADFVDFVFLGEDHRATREAAKAAFEQSGWKPRDAQAPAVQPQEQPALGAAPPPRAAEEELAWKAAQVPKPVVQLQEQPTLGAAPPRAAEEGPSQNDVRPLLGELGTKHFDEEDEDAATDEVGGGKWFWGHSCDSQQPADCSSVVKMSTKLLSAYHRDMIRWRRCPSYPDHLAHSGKGTCPFAGGTMYQAHADCARMLKEVCPLLESGKIERRNELGFLVLDNGLFPEPHRTLGLGSPFDVHRVQRQYGAALVRRIPGRGALLHEVHRFMQGRARIEFPGDVDIWWCRMLWRFLVQLEVDEAQAVEFLKFRDSWLAGSVAQVGQFSIADLTFATDDIHRDMARYRGRIEEKLPADVPRDHRKDVAQGVLETLCFAGGLSVPATITAAVACMHTDVMPEVVSEENVEAFIYEVTRLFPAVQGFPFYKDGQRHILHLAAALRDPNAWGPDADKFTLKDVSLYKDNHLGFADLAKSASNDNDSRYCPGIKAALDASQAFALVLSFWTYRGVAAAEPAWRPTERPKPATRPAFWKPFVLVRDAVDLGKSLPAYQDLIANDGTGEALFADFTPEDFKAFVDKVDADGDGVPDSLGAMNTFTKLFYKLSKLVWADNRKITHVEIPTRPAETFTNKNSFAPPIGKGGLLRMPKEDEHWAGMPLHQMLVQSAMVHLNGSMSDSIDSALLVESEEHRREAVYLAKKAFEKADGGVYLPTPKDRWEEFASDRAQGLLARYSIGQLDLKLNSNPRFQGLGEFVVDACSDLLVSLPVRDPEMFERLGAAAFFDRGDTGELKITAIDWRHGDKTVRPGDDDWEHAKYAWRCSLGVKVTAVNHLVWCHWIVSNAFSTSLREAFDAEHPIRRLLHVHLFDTASINYASFWSLYPEDGFLHRMTPFEYTGLVDTFNAAFSLFEYKTWPQAYEECDVPEDVKKTMPMWEDGLTVWGALREFYASYVDLYYASDSEVLADAAIQKYWKFSTTPQYTKGLPALSKEALIDQITHSAFWVCAYHELVGGAVEFVTDPTGLFFQVRPGQVMADKQHMIQALALTASTGSPMPLISGDWAYLLDLGPTAATNHFAEARVLFDKLQKRLRDVSEEIAERNKTRPQSFSCFDPLTFECSVSL